MSNSKIVWLSMWLMWIAAPFAAALPSHTSGNTTILTVGAGGGCTHNSIQAAIDAATLLRPHRYEIQIVDPGSALLTNLTIAGSNRELSLEGGYADCQGALAASAMSTLSGAPGAGSVVRVSATNSVVELRRLTIRDGTPAIAQSSGGGVFIGSSSFVLIEGSTVTRNRAAQGGGVYVSSGARLIIDAGSVISLNQAINGDGGGVYCSGGVVTWDDGGIVSNTADRSGGGLYLTNGCALALSRATPVVNGVLLANNRSLGTWDLFDTSDAVGGGGMYITGRSSVTSDSSAPSIITGNTARLTGGGILLAGDLSATDLERASFTGRNVSLFDNRAGVEGGGVWLRDRVSLVLERGSLYRCGSAPIAEYCSQISNNQVLASLCTGLPACSSSGLGGAIFSETADPANNSFANAPKVSLQRQIVRRNSAGVGQDGCSGICGEMVLGIGNSVITEHAGFVTIALIHDGAVNTTPTTNIWFSSLVANSSVSLITGIVSIVGHAHPVDFYGSVIYNPGVNVQSTLSRIIVQPTSCPALMNEIASTSFGGARGELGNPQLDAQFRPNANSPAVDSCPVDIAWSPDWRGQTRPVDLPKADLRGPQDRGAIEATAADDLIFSNGYE
jgi:hypothetical protein